MASGNFILDKGFDAATALSKFRFVKISGAETVTAVTGIADDPIGVNQFAVTVAQIAKGKGASVRLLGISEIETAGAVAVGDRLQLENDGRVSTVVGASGKRIVGKCVGSAAANAGDRISGLIIQGLGVA